MFLPAGTTGFTLCIDVIRHADNVHGTIFYHTRHNSIRIVTYDPKASVAAELLGHCADSKDDLHSSTAASGGARVVIGGSPLPAARIAHPPSPRGSCVLC